MEELERLSKEIESVKTEVEQKQKSLSKLALTHEEPSQSHMTSFRNTNMRQDFLENRPLPKEEWHEPSKNEESQARKYVLDHKCPATDLEYDPLLNYSAELLGASKATQAEPDEQQVCHLKKSVDENRHMSQESQRPHVSPIRITINLQESDEDDLVIDVPPIMPTSKKPKPLRGFKYQNMDERVPIMSPEERSLQITGTEEEKIDKTQLTTQVDDDGNKSEPPESLTHSSLDIKSNVNLNRAKNHLPKMRSCGGGKNYVCISGESIPHAPLSDKEKQNRMHNESYPHHKKYVKTIGNPHNEETEGWYSSRPQVSSAGERAEGEVLERPDNSRDLTTFEDRKVVEFDFGKEPTEEDTPSHSGDTRKECLRIFTEFTESEACKGETTKQASGKQTGLDKLYYQNLSGPKKRIAHIAKFNVPTSKDILSPFRETVAPLMSRPGILRAQQQAAQITADIKSGQAFVAATSEQKKTTFACPVSQTQRRVSGENSLTSNKLHQDVLLSREKPNAKPSRSHIPVKSVAAFPVKMPKYKVAHRKRALVTSESSVKVPEEVRQRYVNLFVEKYLTVYKTEDEAVNKAKIEEKAIYERCGSRNMYVNIAINTLKKLRDQGVPGSNNNDKTTGLKKNEKKSALTGIVLYRHLQDYLLTEEQLHENDYPQPSPEKPGSILLNPGMTKALLNDTSRKICCRCGKIYGVTPAGKHSRVEECYYHFGRVLTQKVLGGSETRYSCCEGVLGSAGCQVAKLHVHDQKENLEGFVKTFVKSPPPDGNHGVFAVNCEVCYTAKGLELTQVTVVDPSLQVVYATFVKPDEEVIDYNTRFSGVVEEDLKNIKTSIRDVQAILLNLFSADTVLIGHSFENSLYALKLIHTSVVDTTVLFPHRLGLPHKRSLKSLVADYLQRIIQDDGHNSIDNATACMELVLWKVKEDLKGRK
ncbi:putative exonuclease GOR [Prionailurus bengalensis]|uniref:putative exonuclease GOR n=1 Tax=Prionailurus bengalensis TaxID=37029 RepID=UPI001CA95F70|nr:putative exonuclease GOR [Prionailurus bengalensis]